MGSQSMRLCRSYIYLEFKRSKEKDEGFLAGVLQNLTRSQHFYCAQRSAPRSGPRSAGKFSARYISSEEESVFPVFLGDIFHVFSLKRGILECNCFNMSINCR